MTIIFSTKNSDYKNKSSEKNTKTVESPHAIGPYSKAYKAGELLFCSGQIALEPRKMEMVKGGIEEQTRQVCRNITGVLSEYGLGLKDVVKTTIYLKNIDDFTVVNNIYSDYFVLKPARSTVEVSSLPKRALIEIEVIAQF